MGVTGVIFFIVLLIIEYRVLSGLIYLISSFCQRKLPKRSEETIDDDVAEEKRRIDMLSKDEIEDHNLVMQKLSKFYGSFLAVNQISIGIKR